MDKLFKEDVESIRKRAVPLSHGTTIIKSRDKGEQLNRILQSKYRSGVGTLNYLVKHTRPEIGNAVRELSKVLGEATEAHMTNMKQVIKFILCTRKRGLRFAPSKKEIWEITAFSDSDFAGDRDTRRSVTGYSIYVNGTLVSWKSRSQKHVTLSSTEAEYVAMSETCMAIMHVKQLIEFMGIEVKTPIELNVDNQEAIFLANNASSSRTRHIDTRYHYVRELAEETNPIVKIVYRRTEDNKADIHTKNVAEKTMDNLTKDQSVDFYEDEESKEVEIPSENG
jgi:hypothetical protein